MRYELTARTYERGKIITYFKTDRHIEDDDLQQLRALMISQLKKPLGLYGDADIALLADMKDRTYTLQIVEPIRVPYIHKLRLVIEM